MMGNMNNSMNGSMNRMGGTSKDALLMAVNQAGFAVTEANLYLDTHPCDSQAIAYLKQMSQAYADARNAGCKDRDDRYYCKANCTNENNIIQNLI